MPTMSDVEKLLQKLKEKDILTDYDLGVLATLKWLRGKPNPYDGRVE